ncbi:hypothetical protein GWI33_014270 [Rhynchophorus ferrugineus]|uniref:Integrase catalytic domain-containing protein n=1 Tax=Rhynchophorus ferrugineus TaxID=354439 RepID=A0A834M722_RHYFE|nr:hypothetical protein GWI33_014270 [Rhynchophorus ferrugineus]
MMNTLNIKLHLIAKSAPRANGQVERYVSTVINLLRTELTEKAEWPNVSQKLQNALNTTVQKTTGFSPMYLLTGQNNSTYEIEALTDMILPKIRNRNVNLEDRMLAYERTKEKANYAKAIFDKNRKANKNIQIGDFVYHPSGNPHLSKLDPKYEGPFEVLHILPNNRREIRNPTTSRKRIVARDMIRTWPRDLF